MYSDINLDSVLSKEESAKQDESTLLESLFEIKFLISSPYLFAGAKEAILLFYTGKAETTELVWM